jgi:hypothetical protein
MSEVKRVWLKHDETGHVWGDCVDDPSVIAEFVKKGWRVVSYEEANPVDPSYYGTYDGDAYKESATPDGASATNEEKE